MIPQSLLAMLLAAEPLMPSEPQTLVLSHRGATHTWPANTVEAIEDALAEGFPGFEIDVRFTADFQPVLSHDDNLHAATNCRGRVKYSWLADLRRCTVIMSPLLPELRTGGKRAKRFSRIPSFSEIVDRFLPRQKVEKIVVDLKSQLRPADIARLRQVIPAKFDEKLLFITQHEEETSWLRAEFPTAGIALESNATTSGLIDSFANGADFWREGLSYDTLSLSFGSIDDPRLRLVKLVRFENQRPALRFDRLYRCNLSAPPRRRKDLLVWTVNNGAGIRRVARYQPRYVLTDLTFPEFMKRMPRAASPLPVTLARDCPPSIPASR